jgi:hypothetical protein
MKLKLVIALSALIALTGLAHAQPAPSKPTKASVQKVVQIITSDKTKSQIYCQLGKLTDQMAAADQKKDEKTLQQLGEQADALSQKLGPEYVDLMNGLSDVDENSPEGKEFAALLAPLDKLCGN